MIHRFTAASVTLLLLLGQLNVSYGFVCNNNGHRISTANSFDINRQVQCWALPTAEESAQALTDYMAKSHEEKLKAVKVAEEKSKTEIESLKDKIEELESIPSSSAIVNTPPAAVAGSVEEMSEKLIAYQKFMATYIVNAQEEKIKAIKAAEAAVSKKYEDKLSTFMLSGSVAEEPAAAAATSIVVDENAPGSKIYKERNAKVTAAAKAGKSRWGDQEVQRVSSTATTTTTTTTSIAAPATTTKATAVSTPVPTPPEVTAADHGLRADGGVGGLTLAERVALGAESKANGAVSPSATTVVNGALSPMNEMTGYYNKRNTNIAAAAKAGKQYRWGGMEEKKAIAMAESTPALVGSGPSLAERVNLGASILNSN